MPTKDSSSPSPRTRSIPVSTWIGLALTVFLGAAALVSGGFWSMALMGSLLILATAVYGVLFVRRT